MATTLTVSLLQETRVIASWDETLGASLTDYSFTLTTNQRATISNWHHLRLRLTSTNGVTEVTFASLETPEASGADAPAPSESPSPSGSATPSTSPSASPSGSASGSESASPSATSAPPSFEVDLYCGVTLVASYLLPLDTALTTYSHRLTTEEYGRVSDWTDLRLAFVADVDQVEVTFADIQAGETIGSGSESGSASPSYSGSASDSGSASPSASGSVSPSPSVSASASGSESASASGEDVAFALEVRQGGVLIARRAVDVAADYATVHFALTLEERAALTTWSTVEVWLIADGDQVDVSWVQIEAYGASGVSASGSPSRSASPSPSGSPSRSASPSASASPSRSASSSESGSESASYSGEPTQFGRPIADLLDGGWTNEQDSATNLYASVGEVTRDDDTYIKSGLAPSDDLCKLTLSPIIHPGDGTATIRIVGRWR
jgi:hypothetical protein